MHAKIMDVPYWKTPITAVEQVISFVGLSKKQIHYKQQPFANREQLVSSLDSYFQFMYYIFYTTHIF